MPQQAATVENLGQAFEMVKAMHGDGLGWGEDFRPLAGQALTEIIEGRMAEAVLARYSPELRSMPSFRHSARVWLSDRRTT